MNCLNLLLYRAEKHRVIELEFRTILVYSRVNGCALPRASETKAALRKSAEWWLMMKSLREHPDDDSLERYLRGAIDEKEVPGIEEHLLICHACVEKAEKLQKYLETMRQATGTRKSNANAARRGKPN